MFIFSFVGYEDLKYQDYTYTALGYALGWFLALGSMILVPLYFLYALVVAEGDLKTVSHISIKRKKFLTWICNKHAHKEN